MLKEATEDMPQGVTIKFRNGSIFNLSRLKASTKVTEALIRELLFADDCMMSCHTQPDLQHNNDKVIKRCKRCGLQISITKTEVIYQPAPGKPYIEPTITIDNLQLHITKQFKITKRHGSVQ